MDWKSDKQAVAAIGLSDTQIGQLLGKSRQAVNIGLNRKSEYFSILELKALWAAVAADGGVRAAAFREYVETSRPDAAAQVLGVETPAGLSLESAGAPVTGVWAILPDFRFFFKEFKDAANSVAKLHQRHEKDFVLFTANSLDVESFRAFVGHDAAGSNAIVEPIVNAFPYLLILNPTDIQNSACFVLADGSFHQISDVRGGEIMRHFRKLEQERRGDNTKTAASDGPQVGAVY